MRPALRAALVSAAALPLTIAVPGLASAATAGDVTYAFAVDGNSVTNTITNNTTGVLTCTTSLAPAPGGILPPVWEVTGAGQTLYASGEVQPGSTVQTVTDVADGPYVALATCADAGNTAMWVSDYPGIGETLALFPLEAFTVEQASPVVTVPSAPPVLPAPNDEPTTNPIFGSS